MGSKHAAWLMLAAINDGCAEDVRCTLAGIDKFIPLGSTASEWERRDLLEGLGAEVIAGRNANTACRALLEHIAGPDRTALRVQ